jgi:hypothetical protein
MRPPFFIWPQTFRPERPWGIFWASLTRTGLCWGRGSGMGDRRPGKMKRVERHAILAGSCGPSMPDATRPLGRPRVLGVATSSGDLPEAVERPWKMVHRLEKNVGHFYRIDELAKNRNLLPTGSSTLS